MKHFFSLLILLLGQFSHLSAQTFEWVQPISSHDHYEIRSVCTDLSGNSYMVGSFLGALSFNDFTLHAKGSTDIFLAKYNSQGQLLWVQQLGDTDSESAASIKADPTGNVYLTGGFGSQLSFGSHSLKGSGESNLFVAKCDSSGTWLWAKSAGGSKVTYGNKVSTDEQGNAFVTGYYSETTTFDNTHLSSTRAMGQAFIAKYQADGQLAWAKPAGATEEGTGIATDKQGNVYLTGYYSGNILYENVSLPASGGNDIFVAKYDLTGKLLWVKTAIGEQEDNYHNSTDLCVDQMGSIYLTGYYDRHLNFGKTSVSSNSKSSFVAKYRSDGSFEWVRQPENNDASGDEGAKSICVDGEGNISVTGVFTESIAFGNTRLYTPAISFYIVSYDSQGNVRWAKNPSGEYQAISEAVAADHQGNFLLAGNFSGAPAFDSHTPPAKASLNGFLTKISTATVQQITLINATSNQDIQKINEGDEINKSALPTQQLNIRADLLPGIAAASVSFDLDGTITIDNQAPFSIGGDNAGDYAAWDLPAGTHLLKITPYSQPEAQGQSYMPFIIRFTVNEGTQTVQNFTLVDAATGKDLASLKEGDKLDLAKLPAQLSIRANTSPEKLGTGSVAFQLNGTEDQLNFTANNHPYAIAGSTEGKYKPWLIHYGGNYTLQAAPYTLANGQGTRGGEHAINFSIINSANLAPVVNAGKDTTITLTGQTMLVKLAGAASDADGQIASYKWTQLKGPAQAYIYDPGAPNTLLSNLKAGTYVFKLTVTDNFQAAGFDEVTINVRSGQSPSEIQGFTLVNADTEEDIAPLTDGYVIDYSKIGTRNINIRANAEAAGSVVFQLNKDAFTNNAAPFTLAGAENSHQGIDYQSLNPVLDSGTYTLKAIPYTQADGQGTQGNELNITFTVVKDNNVLLTTEMIKAPATTLHAYPNPFQDRITLEFNVAESVHVSLAIYDMQGRLVSALYEGTSSVGAVKKLEFDGSHLPAGMYMCRLTSGKQVIVHKLILSK